MGQRIVVTGAGGFVGSAIAAALAGAGHLVLATDLAFDTPTRVRLAGVTLVEAPLPQAFGEISGGADAVVHGAAITAAPETFGLSPAGHVRANTDLLTAALDGARGQGAARFVFLSSSGVFGSVPGPIDETSPVTATDPYSAAKRAGEILLQGAAEPCFAPLSLRLGPVFGPHEAARATRPNLSLVARMIAAARAGGEIPVATPDAARDWSYLPDIARAVALLLAHPGALPPLLHVTSGQIVTDLALAQAIAAALPGTRVTPGASVAHQPKAAMVSRVPSPLTGFGWTPLDAALRAMLAEPAGVGV
jgi:UDP-glucose 4-epimerase